MNNSELMNRHFQPMKTRSWNLFLVAFLASSSLTQGQNAALTEPAIVSRGPHSRTWERAEVRALPNGRSITNRSSYTELEVGLHRRNEIGEWITSSELIELFEGAAIARQGPYQVIWAANANSPGAVDLLTSDNKRMRSHVIGLGVFDPATGNSELLAEIKDCLGELHPPQQILYRDAFDGILADLRYVYRKSGFIQDVVVRERVSLPAGYGPDSRLEIWTEFIEAPTPVKRAQVRASMTDESLDFGAMQMSAGKAFALGEAEGKGAPVSKRWLQIDQRTFLVEGVRFSAVAAELNRLPAPRQQAAVRWPKGEQMAKADANRRPFPPPRQAKAKDPNAKIQVAGLLPPGRGLVIDYDLSGTITGLVLKADTTYYISGSVNLYCALRVDVLRRVTVFPRGSEHFGHCS